MCPKNYESLFEYSIIPVHLFVWKPVEIPVADYDVSVVVSGGGHSGQVDAIRLGIAKALVEKDENLKSTLRRADLLGRDSRERERKKFGLKGARKQRQFTKR